MRPQLTYSRRRESEFDSKSQASVCHEAKTRSGRRGEKHPMRFIPDHPGRRFEVPVMPAPPARFPLNAPGDFFVEDGACMGCQAPEAAAPDLMAAVDTPEHGYHCYFRRQPSTPAEVERATVAVYVSCCAGVQYGGTDPQVLGRLGRLKRQGWHPPGPDA